MKPWHLIVIALLMSCLPFCVSFADDQQIRYAGIEIGGSGAKGFIYTTNAKNGARLESKKIALNDDGVILRALTIENRDIGVVSALSENTFSKSAIKLIAKNVAEIFKAAVSEKNRVTPDHIYIVGSSSVERIRNVGELIAEVKKQILTVEPKLGKEFFEIAQRSIGDRIAFIGPEQEAIFSLLDAIDKIAKDSISRTNSILIDIGAGNTKLAYLGYDKNIKKWIPYTYEIPYGTDTLARRLSTSREEKCKDATVTELCNEVTEEEAFRDFRKRALNAAPGFFESVSGDYRNILLVGGSMWAVTKLTHLSDSCLPFTRLRLEDVDSAIKTSSQLALLLQKQSLISVDNCDLQSESRSVLKVYSEKGAELKAGIMLLRWILGEISDPAKFNNPNNSPVDRPMFVPNRQNDWLRWYLTWKLEEHPISDPSAQPFKLYINIPPYTPTISKRSIDILRDDQR